MKYTERVHALRLVKMLQRRDPCSLCPAQKYFVCEGNFIGHPNLPPYHPTPTSADVELRRQGNKHRRKLCTVCREFVGMYTTDGCPCYYYGTEEAIAMTVDKLKEKGYLGG